jgi:hypothetical protein
MPFKHPSGTGRLSQQLRDVQREVSRTARGRSNGMNRRVTPRGVVEWPIARPTLGGTQGSGYVAVWL